MDNHIIKYLSNILNQLNSNENQYLINQHIEKDKEFYKKMSKLGQKKAIELTVTRKN